MINREPGRDRFELPDAEDMDVCEHGVTGNDVCEECGVKADAIAEEDQAWDAVFGGEGGEQ